MAGIAKYEEQDAVVTANSGIPNLGKGVREVHLEKLSWDLKMNWNQRQVGISMWEEMASSSV